MSELWPCELAPLDDRAGSDAIGEALAEEAADERFEAAQEQAALDELIEFLMLLEAGVAA